MVVSRKVDRLVNGFVDVWVCSPLQILHEILNKMGGMPGAYDEGLTDSIIRGRGGGETLKMETAMFGLREKVSGRGEPGRRGVQGASQGWRGCVRLGGFERLW